MDDITTAIKQRFEQALTLFKEGKSNTARAICKEILQVRQNEPHTLQLLGLIAIAESQHKEAISFLKASLTELPNDPVCHHNLASAYSMAGLFAEAEKHYQKAFELNPQYAEAYFNFAFCADLNKYPDFILKVTALLKDTTLTKRNRTLLHYAAGKYYHGCRNFTEAFAHFDKANELQIHNFSSEKYNHLVSATEQSFTQDLFLKFKSAGDLENQPIFIVGLPTAGCALVDNLLCYHPEIASTKANTDFMVLSKELSLAQPGHQFYPECLVHLTPEQIKNLAKVYIEHLQKNSHKRYIINSFPLNFIYIGLIKLLFPKALFIHIDRHPEDASLACYFTLLQNHCEFSHSLEHLADFHKGYATLLQHWKTLFSKDILSLNYEELLANPESNMKKILNFLQLPWDPNCINATLLEKDSNYPPGFSSQYLPHIAILHSKLMPFIQEYIVK